MQIASLFISLVMGTIFVSGQVESLCPFLGSAEDFSVLAYSTITSEGNTVISGGDIGVSPGSAIEGFPPGLLSTGAQRTTSDSNTAQGSVTFLQAQLSEYACTSDPTAPGLGGQTLTPGVFCFDDIATLATALVLDAEGDSSAIFIFRIPGTLITSSASAVTLVNDAQACNVFWQVGSSVTLASGTEFMGVIVAYASISIVSGATLGGRAFARTGAVTLDTNTITWCSCVGNITDVTEPSFDTNPLTSSDGTDATSTTATPSDTTFTATGDTTTSTTATDGTTTSTVTQTGTSMDSSSSHISAVVTLLYIALLFVSIV